MKRAVKVLIEDARTRMSSYLGMYVYRLMNLCIKAEPMALLSVTVQTENGEENLEKVANVYRPDDFHFYIVPNDPEEIAKVGKAVLLQHPEFSQEVKTAENTDDDGNKEEVEYLYVSMPEVNKDRYNVLTDGVKILSDEVKIKLEETYNLFKVRIEAKLAGAGKEEREEAEKSLKDLQEMAESKMGEYQKKKLSDIDEAYQNYLSKEEEKKKEKEKEDKTNSKRAGMSMRMFGQDEDDE